MPEATPQPEDYLKQLVAAIIAGAAAGVATFAPGELPTWVSAVVTALASIVGWVIGRVLTHRRHRAANALLAIAVALGALGLIKTTTPSQCAPKGVTCFVGECDAYSVYAQNRYKPYGAALRAEPLREATQLGAYDPNQLIPVDGWVRTAPAYPHNSPPFNNDVWFHVANDSGWVSFAGVRADPTTPALDPRDDDGGAPAPTPDSCRGTFRSNE